MDQADNSVQEETSTKKPKDGLGLGGLLCKLIFRGTYGKLNSEIVKLKDDLKGLEFYVTNLEKDVTRVSQAASSSDSIKFGIHEPFVAFRSDYLITYANDAFITLMGLNKAEVVNKMHVNEIFMRIEIVEQIDAIVKEKVSISNFEMSFVDKDFRHITGLFNGGPLLTSTKEVMGGYLMCRDITALRMIINSIVDVANGRLQVEQVENKLSTGIDFITATEADLGMSFDSERDLKDKASMDLFSAFSHMLSELRRLAVQARIIAKGDLHNKVLDTRISGELGAAFFVMTENLRNLASVATKIANGDLTTKIESRSKDDVLAAAFTKMSDDLRKLIAQIHSTSDKVASSAEELSSSTEEMNASTQEVSTAIQQVSKGATHQAERVEETFEIMEKTAISLKQVVANAQSTSRAVSETSEKAEAGRISAQEAVAKIEHLVSIVNATSKVIQDLGQTSQQIGEITETITSIADQTNLLALNAAIEAARAGEAGRGFAVVAEEVRKLAERSAEAVRKIGGLIKSIQSETGRAVGAIETSSKEVQEGKAQVSKIADLLIEINKAATDANGLVNQIVASGKQRVEESDKVVKSINEIANIAKDSASTAEEVSSSSEEQTASMEEVSASAQELSRLAMDLKDAVEKFKISDDSASGDAVKKQQKLGK